MASEEKLRMPVMVSCKNSANRCLSGLIWPEILGMAEECIIGIDAAWTARQPSVTFDQMNQNGTGSFRQSGNKMPTVSTHTDIILETLEAQDGLCDGCLVNVTGITPHQAVNGACRRLVDRQKLRRDHQVCWRCGQMRIVNLLPTPKARSQTHEPILQQSDAGTAEWFDDVRRKLTVHLNRVEAATPKGEPFSRRVQRLRDDGRIPGPIACLIQTVNGFRNLTCYEEHRLSEFQRVIVELAYQEIQQWMKQ
jgi:hypothetical protein